MNISTKLLKAAAGSAGGAGLDVDEVFSTFLYNGIGSAQTITNGIDLNGEGGLVWTKQRSDVRDHQLYDTARGADKALESSDTIAQHTGGAGVIAFNSNGFNLGAGSRANQNGEEYVSWTFRKAPKFFDIIDHTQTGSEPSTVTLNHNLGCDVGMIIAKVYSHTNAWIVWHKDLGSNYSMNFDTDAKSYFGGTGVSTSSTSITIPGSWVHAGYDSQNTIIYVFAHNNSDGGFGPDADQDIIKCGSYNGTGTSGNFINLGFEPQFLLIKKTTSSQNAHWWMLDAMRGLTVGGDDELVYANSSDASFDSAQVDLRANGFALTSTGHSFNGSGDTYIYVAIRRGPLATPTSATNVFAMDTRGSTGDGAEPAFRSTFPVDFALAKDIDSATNWTAKTRLIGKKDLNPNTTSAEQGANYNLFDYMNGHFARTNTASDEQSWMWKRAPSYFDVVAYQGTGSAGFTFNHNLGVKPEMIWVKNRGASEYWAVYHKDLNGGTNPSHYYLKLNDTNAEFDYNEIWNDTEPTATQVTVGQQGVVNSSSFSHIAYLFATVAGVSKVGSYAGSNSDQTIDCGFTNGARFVLCKALDDVQNWVVWDSLRGIVAGNEPYLVLDRSDAQITGQDRIDPHSSGFTLTGNFSGANQAGYNFVFYAIA